MIINIEYSASWRNSFLDGSNNEPLPRKGRGFVGSMAKLGKEENYIERNISHDTAMGILNRLIGEQKKLYQARQSDGYYFKDAEKAVTFVDDAEITQEYTFIRNVTGNTDRNSYTGAINADDEAFSSDFSRQLWGVLFLDVNQLCEFILGDRAVIDVSADLNPLAICELLNEIGKAKPIAREGIAADALKVLQDAFEDGNYVNAKEKIKVINLYCSALHLQAARLSGKFDMSCLITKSGCIPGISKNNFTQSDFMKRFTTGKPKKIYGNPYIREAFIKGVGKEKLTMRKARGKLTISIDVDRARAEEIKQMIESAGVSSFYIGKKGLAYVTNIDTRENR